MNTTLKDREARERRMALKDAISRYSKKAAIEKAVDEIDHFLDTNFQEEKPAIRS